jgi:hypothetical protein
VLLLSLAHLDFAVRAFQIYRLVYAKVMPFYEAQLVLYVVAFCRLVAQKQLCWL